MGVLRDGLKTVGRHPRLWLGSAVGAPSALALAIQAGSWWSRVGWLLLSFGCLILFVGPFIEAAMLRRPSKGAHATPLGTLGRTRDDKADV